MQGASPSQPQMSAEGASFPIIGQAYTQASLNINAQTLKNWYVVNDQTGKTPTALLPMPACNLFASLDGGNQVRGIWENSGNVYCVIDSGFYTLSQNGTLVLIGNLLTSIKGPITFQANESGAYPNQIMISDDIWGYVYNIPGPPLKNTIFTTVKSGSNIILGSVLGLSVGDNITITLDSGDTLVTTVTGVNLITATISLKDVLPSQASQGNSVTSFSPVFNKITDPNFTGCGPLEFLNGFCIFPIPGQDLIQSTTAENFNNYSANIGPNLASVTSMSEPIVGLCRRQIELYVFTHKGAEIYVPSTNSFPFQRRDDVSITQGLASGHAALDVNNTLYWMARTSYGEGVGVYGYYDLTQQKYSTEPIENIIQGYTNKQDVIAYSMYWKGHLFIVWIFPTDDATWVFDISTNSWFQWTSYNERTRQFGRHLSNCHTYAFGKHLVGDYKSGNIYFLDDSTYLDNGYVIERERTCKHIWQEDKYTQINNLSILFEGGVGINSGQGKSPNVMFSISHDNGHTYGPEMMRPIGAMGNYKTRSVLERVGIERDTVLKIRITDPIRAAVIGASADVEKEDD